MRTRVKTFGSASRTRYVRDAGGATYQIVPTTYVSKTSVMEDVVGNYGGNNRCVHTVTENEGGNGSFSVLSSTNDLLFNHEPWFTDGLSWYTSVSGSVQGGLNQFIKRGIESIQPKLKSDISVPNFLIELRELKSLASSIKSGLELVRGSTRKPGRKTDLGDVAADIHLSSSFGFKPLISDIFGLSTSYNEFLRKWKNLKKHSKRVVKSHYREPLVGGPQITTTWPSAQWTHIEDASFVSGHVTLTLEYTYTPLVEFGAPNWVKYAQYVGFRKSALPSIIWNAIPYSFMVDWVFKFGDFLENRDNGVIPVRMEITAATLSIKTKMRSSQRLVARSGYKLLPEPNRVWTRTTYTRGPVDTSWISILQSSPALPTFDGLSVKELSLGIALGNKLRK